MPFGEIVIFSLKFGKLIGGKLGELSHMLIKEHNAFIFFVISSFHCSN